MIHPFEIYEYKQVLHFLLQYNTDFYAYDVENTPALVLVI